MALRCFSAADVLLLVVVLCCWAIEIFSIGNDNLMGYGLTLQFGPINFRCRSLMAFPSCLTVNYDRDRAVSDYDHQVSLYHLKIAIQWKNLFQCTLTKSFHYIDTVQ